MENQTAEDERPEAERNHAYESTGHAEPDLAERCETRSGERGQK